MKFAVQTDPGRVRTSNQDSFFCAHLGPDWDAYLYAVADGMGGYDGGEVASFLAISTLVDHLKRVGPGTPQHEIPGLLKAGFRLANEAIVDAAARTEHQGMGTTLTACLVLEGIAYLAHVGDSRAYLWRDGRLNVLTTDHTVVAEMVRNGSLTELEALSHPQRHVLTRALGAPGTLAVDVTTWPLRTDDLLLLCSDGLTSLVTSDELAEVIATEPFELLTNRLIAMANERGGHDNTTVAVATPGGGAA